MDIIYLFIYLLTVFQLLRLYMQYRRMNANSVQFNINLYTK